MHRTSDVAATVRAILGEGQRVGVPAGFRDLGLPVIEDHDLSVAELDALDAVVTGSALAIADTGTIVLVSARTPAAGPSHSSRIITSASSRRAPSWPRCPTRSPRSAPTRR